MPKANERERASGLQNGWKAGCVVEGAERGMAGPGWLGGDGESHGGFTTGAEKKLSAFDWMLRFLKTEKTITGLPSG